MSSAPPTQSSILKTFYLDGVIISSPNADLPHIVDEKAMRQIFSDPPFPRECREIRFSSNTYPWLVFAPKKPKFKGRLFGVLLCNKHTIEADKWIEWRHHACFLKQEIYDEWLSLEVSLGNIAQDLLAYSGVALPLDCAWFPMPSRYNYHHGDYGREKFARSILLARDAFVPLMTICSFAIAMTQQFATDNPPWARRLTDQGIHPSFIDELKNSQVADFSVNSRVGVFIRSDWDFQPYIDRFVSANVPVWLVWSKPTSFTHHRMIPYRPTEAQVAGARWRPHQNGLQPKVAAPPVAETILAETSASSVANGSSIVDDAPQPFPPLPAQSRQLVGETLKEFFARQHREFEERVANEMPHERARRLNREKVQMKHPMPGRTGPRVFIWDDVDGYLIRKILERKSVEDEWENYTDDQRLYNSVLHEWDMAKEFAPEQEAVDPFEEYQYREYMGFPDQDVSDIELAPDSNRMVLDPLPEPATPILTPHTLPPPNFTIVLDRAYHSLEPVTVLKGLESLDLVIYNRYGFLWSHQQTYDPVSVWGFSRPSPDWKKTKRTVCDDTSHWDPRLEWLQDPFSDFVNCFLASDASQVQVPSALWDVAIENPLHIFRAGHKRSLRVWKLEGNIVYNIDIGCDRKGKQKADYYDPPYEIIVYDLLTALECVRRRSLITRRDTVKHLVTTGKAFRTIAEMSTLSAYGQYDFATDHCPPGYRKSTWKPTLIDFRQYETDREAFLLTPRARAAVTAGGILWRLSVQSIDLEYVMAGPSEEVCATTSSMKIKGLNGQYFDDELTSDEVDIVCGVYKIYTGM